MMAFFQKFFDSRGGALKKKTSTVIVWVIIAIIALVAVGGLFDNDTAKEQKDKSADESAKGLSFTYDYISRQEKMLSEKLSKVQGAGNVTVAIYVDDIGESVLAKNVSTSNEQSGEEGENSSTRNESVVLKGSGSSGEPIIITENMPQISGVIVISSGAGDERIENELYESVKALFGIPSHRIKILTGNQ